VVFDRGNGSFISISICYVDDLLAQLRQRGFGLHIGQLFVGCAVYADVIALLSASCYGL